MPEAPVADRIDARPVRESAGGNLGVVATTLARRVPARQWLCAARFTGHRLSV